MNLINIDFSSELIVYINATGEIIKGNKAFKNKWSYTTIWDCIHKDHHKELQLWLKTNNHVFEFFSHQNKAHMKDAVAWIFRRTENNLIIGIGSEKSITTTLFNRTRKNQKFEAIGQMAAGIAHEINSPSQFVNNNQAFLKESFQEIFNYLLELKSFLQHNNSEEAKKLLQQWETLDLDFMKEDIEDAIIESQEGLTRIRNIVRALRDFSHPSSKDMREANLHQGLETTITIAKNEWKYDCDLETDFAENLPLVNCDLNALNQVFLNLIVNATHTIKDAIKQKKYNHGLIKISTKETDNFIHILISDNGLGIPEDIRAKIFERFFTTKKVGVGTGQGLAIVKEIIDKHNGRIEVQSEPGEGTTFDILLPK